MNIYDVRLYTDMGHLLTKPDNLPKEITDFVYLKAKMYLSSATDTRGMGAAYYILKPGLDKKRAYIFNPYITVNIYYDVDEFDSCRMKYLKT